ncbi:ammonia-forming cytochrome c nitrite reductase subunit c552 [Metallumcola ferriviriculae]|uniref:Ammonia-forming cytochrome c nitrite reductase subunit c552 n=1 Tax=Metallumcola ferriviriculae TaxID=3039180 RepID=A0AAU0USL9_9FIRM|nr:ammonia-forming cytochrome c nitrite reductase subunit c552 [Desulfitibacteraceae bacterium MK1]
MKRRGILLLMVLALVVLSGVGCANNTPAPDTNNNNNNQGDVQGNQQQTPKDMNVAQIIYDQWKGSAHATAVEENDPENSPALREGGGCFKCHNGYGFELNPDTLEGIGILKGQSCDTCHTKYGHDLATSGSVEIPLGTIKGGKGALCIACHNGRGKEPDQVKAPHHSVQTDMLLAKSGAEVEGFDYSTHSHAGADNKCLACHMAADDNTIKDHTFKMNKENIANSCGRCHDFDSFNPTARDDFDGDGNKEGYQDEVKGLADMLEKTINEKLGDKKFESSHGKIVFTDAQGNALDAPPSEEVYNAAWNLLFVRYDGSNGVHNPNYSVQLLQQSYKLLTGEDVPNAKMK